MHFDFRRTFKPTPEEQEEDRKKYEKMYNEGAKEKDCTTCRNCKQVKRLPGFVTGEECICTAGLKCDTVLFTVKNCKKYDYRPPHEPMQRDPVLDEPGIYYVL